MAHVCTHSSESWVWKTYVSGRHWLNDTTYWPNSHSGSCAFLEKNNLRGNPTNRESVVSARLEEKTFRVHIWPSLMLPLRQNRSLFILLSDRHHLACFHISNLKSDTFQIWNIFQTNFALELLLKWIRAKNGKCKERSALATNKRERERYGGWRVERD